MSSDKPTLDILDDIFSDVDPDETIVEIPAFQPAPTAPRSRTSRPKAQPAPVEASVPMPPLPVILKPIEWEYREVIFRDYRGWRVRFVDGRELGNWKSGPTLIAYLENAGKEGWELVSISDRHHNQKEAYLKRAKL